MKKLLYLSFLATFALFSSCGDDDAGNPVLVTDFGNAADLDYSSAYAAQWGNYMSVTSSLLLEDAKALYKYWNDDNNGKYGERYANLFKEHNNDTYKSVFDCINDIIDGCETIADEVGNAKIGEPYNYWKSGDHVKAVYAVESWYSWHSRVDYRNNIYSIRNAFFGSLDGSVNANSLSALLEKKNPELNQETVQKINAAIDAIWAIPQPFRNNIATTESARAITACTELAELLGDDLKAEFTSRKYTAAELDPIITQYVDGVILPTYKKLMEKVSVLNDAVQAFRKNPSNNGFKACANAWLDAREPWEQSEAFLFGPVADAGLDPNMDSWPLDQDGIVAILQSNDWKQLTWGGEYEELDEENEDNSSDQAKKIAKAQSLRGFHTLEYFIFKNGEVRRVN